jgi:hypothetical protein
MLGFRKRDTYHKGFLKTAIAVALTVRKELGATGDAVSVAAFLAAFLHSSSLNGGVRADEAAELTELMRQGAFEIFGRSNSVSLLWSASFNTAKTIWDTPGIENRTLEFYRARAALLPWDIDELQYYHFSVTALDATRASVAKDYPRWV